LQAKLARAAEGEAVDKSALKKTKKSKKKKVTTEA